jgi:hypothetical protein
MSYLHIILINAQGNSITIFSIFHAVGVGAIFSAREVWHVRTKMTYTFRVEGVEYKQIQ